MFIFFPYELLSLKLKQNRFFSTTKKKICSILPLFIFYIVFSTYDLPDVIHLSLHQIRWRLGIGSCVVNDEVAVAPRRNGSMNVSG